MANKNWPARPTSYDKKVGSVLQGGGALGSDQAGVYEALASSTYVPDWVAGIFHWCDQCRDYCRQCAEHRVPRLHNFWDEITAPTKMWPSAPTGPLAAWQNRASALETVMFGQPGLFCPAPAAGLVFTR
jgi:NTE family protein